jgi:hypothetical protein
MRIIKKIKSEVLIWSLISLGLGLYLGINNSSPSLLNLVGCSALMAAVGGIFLCISRGNRKAAIPEKYLKHETAVSGD